MTKEEFYQIKENDYKINDLEALLRYNIAIKLASLKNNQTILDIGCKYALLKKILIEKKNNIDYFGIDITDKVFNKIDEFREDRFFVADASKQIPFENKKFDVVFALEILEHVESPTNMLKEIYRVLKPEGILILSVPNIYAWNEIIANIKHLPDTEGHISAFSVQIMNRLVEFANLKVVDYCGTFFRIPFSKRLFKTNYKIIASDNLFLTRSFIFKIKKSEFYESKQ